MPIGTENAAFTARTMLATSEGKVPPLVSHRISTSAPPSTAATSVVSPLGLPNLYESESIYSKAGAERDGTAKMEEEQVADRGGGGGWGA